MLTKIFDIKADPGLIKKDAVPTGSTNDMQKFHTSLMSGGDFTLKVDGVIPTLRLCDDLEGHDTPVLFEVASTLATKAILGTRFIDKHVRCIERDQ